jgi:hypothetical protein
VSEIDPDKYIVFKREDFEPWLYRMNAVDVVPLDGTPVPHALPDAVVIRRQDLFAGPALHSYSNNMAMAARMVAEGDEQKRLLGIADYFHEQAVLADAEGWKLPD